LGEPLNCTYRLSKEDWWGRRIIGRGCGSSSSVAVIAIVLGAELERTS
jgi:hypothetical protein